MQENCKTLTMGDNLSIGKRYNSYCGNISPQPPISELNALCLTIHTSDHD